MNRTIVVLTFTPTDAFGTGLDNMTQPEKEHELLQELASALMPLHLARSNPKLLYTLSAEAELQLGANLEKAKEELDDFLEDQMARARLNVMGVAIQVFNKVAGETIEEHVKRCPACTQRRKDKAREEGHHFGDPCEFCGVPAAEVSEGPCTGACDVDIQAGDKAMGQPHHGHDTEEDFADLDPAAEGGIHTGEPPREERAPGYASPASELCSNNYAQEARHDNGTDAQGADASN